MLKSLITSLAFAIVAASVAGQAQAAGGTHLMWINGYKAAPYAVQHDNATCPNRPR